MTSLRQFIEAKQDQTLTARGLLLPLLALRDDEHPWTSARLEELARTRDALDPAGRRALEHLLRYEVPLLEREEALEALGFDFSAVETGLLDFERLFWEARYAEAMAAGEIAVEPGHAGAERVCQHHAVDEADIRRLARDQGLWDVAALAERTGATTTCGSCRLAITRILIDELTRLKAARGGP
jgi:bacterioferritin-associated ferredoxin